MFHINAEPQLILPMDKNLANYATKGHRTVEGWLAPVAVKAIVEIASLQSVSSVKGPICEIGVHHGRLFILLHLLAEKQEKSVAWDLFQNQEENFDDSGKGSREMLVKNLKLHSCDMEQIVIRTKNSLDLTPDEIISECYGRPRLFSIDGGHTAEVTFNDLGLAASSICEGGVVILDDFFNEAWPGVAEGACRYMIEHPGLFPVVIVGNKLMFTTSEAAAKNYISGLNFKHAGYIPKLTRFFDCDILCYRPITTNFIWKYIRDRPIGHFLKKILKRGKKE